MNTSRKELFVRICLQMLIIVATAVQQIALVPAFLATWSPELYASWLVLFSVSGLLLILDLGLHPYTYLRLQEGVAAKGGRDTAALSRSSASSLYAYGAVILTSGVTAIVLFSLVPASQLLGLHGAPEAELGTAALLMVATGLASVFVSFLSAAARSVDAYKSLTGVRLLQIVVATALTFVGLQMDFGIAGIAAMNLIAMLMSVLIMTGLVVRLMPETLGFPSAPTLRSVIGSLKAATRYLIPVSADATLQNVPILIMSLVRTPAEALVQFTLTRALSGLVRQASGAAVNPLAADIGRLWVRDEKDGVRQVIRVCLTIACAGGGSMIGYFLGFYDALIRVWTHGQIAADPVVFGFLFANVALSLASVVAFTALLYTDQPRDISRTRLQQLVVMIVLALALGVPFGARGVAAAIFFSEVAIVGIPLALSMCRRFDMQLTDLVRSGILPFVACCTLSVLCSVVAHALWPPIGFFDFVVSSLFWLPIPMLVTMLLIFRAMGTKPPVAQLF